MALGRLGDFFGDDWYDTLDSIKSVPGAFGNILMASIRQVRLVDIAALSLVVIGWAWLIATFLLGHDHSTRSIVFALLPTLGWLTTGAVGAIIFEVYGIGPRALTYWESYGLIAFFSLFGTLSLRLALNPKDRLVYRSTGTAPKV